MCFRGCVFPPPFFVLFFFFASLTTPLAHHTDSNFYGDYYTQALENLDTLEHPLSHWKGKSGPGGADKGNGYALSKEKGDAMKKIDKIGDFKSPQHPGLDKQLLDKKLGQSIGVDQRPTVLNHKGAVPGP